MLDSEKSPLWLASPAPGHPTIHWINGPNNKSPTDILTCGVRIVTYPPNSTNATINPSNELAQHLNHWDVILELQDQRRVRLDPVPSPPSMNMTLICTPNSNETDHGALRNWKIEILDISVGQLLDLVKREGLDRYRYTPEGTGCRYWVWCFIDMLQRKALVKNEHEWQEALQGLKIVWDTNGRAEQKWQAEMHVKQGTFY